MGKKSTFFAAYSKEAKKAKKEFLEGFAKVLPQIAERNEREKRNIAYLEGKIEIILNMYNNKMSISLIAKYANLTKKEIITILKEHNITA